MDEPASFGDWLRQRREALHLSRPELAQRASCSVPALRKIELGERRPSRQLAELLATALGLSPDDGATFIRVARGELNLERLPPAAQAGGPASTPTPNLPIPLTPLLGRETELAELARLLSDPYCRLLTVTGAGGIGKTRLALEAACAHSATQATYLVALAALNSAEFVPPAIAEALGFKFSGPADPAAQLLRYLRDKALLLVLDNFEHLLAGVSVLAVILHGVPGVKLLVTSRERLDLHGEWVFDLHGLPVPPAELAQAPSDTSSSAMALFVQSAQRAQAGFEPQADEWPAVARICRLVAGVPLAIELAAAWVPVLSCAEIAQEIERTLASDANLDFLATSKRDVPERHRSMRAVIDHSWKLLSQDERRAMRQLTVFCGGFTRETAERVAGAPLGLLSALAAKSLVQRVGQARYDLHELVRQYAAARLAAEPQEQQSARERHSLYYLTFLEERDGLLRSSRQKDAQAELTPEMENIRAAWEWSVACQSYVPLYRASATLMYLFEVRNWFKEGEATFRKTADALRASPPGSESDTVQQVAWNAMRAHWGFFLLRLGRGEEAYALLASSVAFLRTSAESSAAIYALWYLGIDCWILGRFSEAKESLEECLVLSQKHGVRWYEAWAGEFLGRLALDQGEYDQARGYLSEALAIMRQLGDPTMTAHALSYLGRTMQLLGEYRAAEELLREGLELARGIGYRFALGLALDALGQVAVAETRHTEARDLFSEAASLFRDMGDMHRLSRTLNHQGLNSLAVGDVDDAQQAFKAALTLAYEGGFIPSALNALTGLAALESQNKARQGTLELVIYILQHQSSTQETKNLAVRVNAELQPHFTREQIESARQRARSRDLAEVVRHVLASTDRVNG